MQFRFIFKVGSKGHYRFSPACMPQILQNCICYLHETIPKAHTFIGKVQEETFTHSRIHVHFIVFHHADIKPLHFKLKIYMNPNHSPNFNLIIKIQDGNYSIPDI
jgi:hypothetical protein